MKFFILPDGALIHLTPDIIGKDDGRLDVMTNWIKQNRVMFKDTKVLDLGSNCGHFPFVYSVLGASKVIAIEGREAFIDTFNDIKNEHFINSSIEIIHSDIRDVDYCKIGKVDVLSMIGIFYHIEGIEEFLAKVIDITKPNIIILESQLWDSTHYANEGGSGGDATQAIKHESVLRPNADTVENIISNLQYKSIRFVLSDLYKKDSECVDPRGFWLCLR